MCDLKFNLIWYFYVKCVGMVVFPKAKINLGLRITEKRTDGYHNIETLFYPVGLCDALEFVVTGGSATNDDLTVSGIPVNIKPEENIVIKAVKRLREACSFPFLRIHLHKAIPHGAGLGGGSSDAACMLKSLNRHFHLALSNSVLKSIALETGSDCPFFIDGDPSFATGRGEILQPVSPVLSGYYLLLLNPGVAINTSEAYSNCRPMIPSASLSHLAELKIEEWKELILNDFEAYAFSRHPIIKEIKNGLYESGALFSLMSGSGSSVYGIFREKSDSLPSHLKAMIIWEGTM
jgi:4-diphosphocytidyl-2-C-methyl-D-erythritol kinase